MTTSRMTEIDARIATLRAELEALEAERATEHAVALAQRLPAAMARALAASPIPSCYHAPLGRRRLVARGELTALGALVVEALRGNPVAR